MLLSPLDHTCAHTQSFFPAFLCSAVRDFSTQQKTGTPPKSIPCSLSLSLPLSHHTYMTHAFLKMLKRAENPLARLTPGRRAISLPLFHGFRFMCVYFFTDEVQSHLYRNLRKLSPFQHIIKYNDASPPTIDPLIRAAKAAQGRFTWQAACSRLEQTTTPNTLDQTNIHNT